MRVAGGFMQMHNVKKALLSSDFSSYMKQKNLILFLNVPKQ